MDLIEMMNHPGSNYFERTIGPVSTTTNTAGKCIKFPVGDKQEIKVTVAESGKYIVKGVGSYNGGDYCVVDVLLQIKTNKGQESEQKVIYADYNLPVHLISGKIVCEMKLKKGEVVYLTYGNRVIVRPEAGRFEYGFPGDSLFLVKI
jgi:hypothetical protein